MPADADTQVQIDRTRQPEHGDFATNIALTLAKSARRAPRDLAEQIVSRLPESNQVHKVEIAGPGFINIFMSRTAKLNVIAEIHAHGAAYGRAHDHNPRRVILEFVSANPTGPLHVGHGRGAAYGDALARILKAAGYDVHTEYYVNDAGRQMDILTVSVWLRYLELCGEELAFPAGAYQGDYIYDIAAALHRAVGDKFRTPLELPADEPTKNDEEARLDFLATTARSLRGAAAYTRIAELARDTLLEDIRSDLAQLGVHYDHWFSEQSLIQSGAVSRAIELLEETEHCYRDQGALWFRSSAFGDEKDRVIVRETGVPTYFASDIAYHLDKIARGFDDMIDVWGADHHGYVPRVKAVLQALGEDPQRLTVLLVQFAVLYRGAEKISMSTRAGDFVTLRELRNEVGADAVRFFYVQRKSEQHLDFDLELAKSQSNDNPVYYVQYAHARVCSVFKQACERGIATDNLATADLTLLVEPHEIQHVDTLGRYSEVIESAASHREPHQIAYFLRQVANDFHTYYNAHAYLSAPPPVRAARLALIHATRQVLANGLDLLGVGAPEEM